MQFLRNARKRFDVAELEDDERDVFSRQGLFLYAFTSKVRNGPHRQGDGTALLP